MSDTLFLIARIADRPVAVPADAVESVVDIDTVVPVPRTDRRVLGLAALRSRVVTVIDPRVMLGGGASPLRRAVVTVCGGHSYAVLVDALDDVAAFTAEPLTTGMALDPDWAPLARGLIERAGETLLIVDLAALLPEQALAA